jgi:hypothetical protein
MERQELSRMSCVMGRDFVWGFAPPVLFLLKKERQNRFPRVLWKKDERVRTKDIVPKNVFAALIRKRMHSFSHAVKTEKAYGCALSVSPHSFTDSFYTETTGHTKKLNILKENYL